MYQPHGDQSPSTVQASPSIPHITTELGEAGVCHSETVIHTLAWVKENNFQNPELLKLQS